MVPVKDGMGLIPTPLLGAKIIPVQRGQKWEKASCNQHNLETVWGSLHPLKAEHNKTLLCVNNNNNPISWSHGNKPAVKEGKEEVFFSIYWTSYFFSP